MHTIDAKFVVTLHKLFSSLCKANSDGRITVDEFLACCVRAPLEKN